MAVVNSASGAESLAGTGSADVFTYDAVADSTKANPDTITFSRSQGDKIDLDAVPLTGGGAPASLTFLGQNYGGSQAYGIWQWDAVDGGQLRIDTTGDGLADMAIKITNPDVVFTVDHFILGGSVGGGGTGNQTLTGTSGADTLTGGVGNDTLSGLGGNDSLTGGDGNDNITGSSGVDTISGGNGNDTINGGTGLDTMTGGAGADVFVFANGDGGSVEPHDTITDFVVGTDKIQLPSGYSFIDSEADGANFYVEYSVAGENSTNWIHLEGVGTLSAAQIAALTNPGGTPPPAPAPTGGTSGNDTLTGTSGADSLSGLAGNDSISGLAGADNLQGGAGVDTLLGGDNDDILDGGTGIDTMTGGNGADNFVFVANDGGSVEPHDTITDFVIGTDRLTLPGSIRATEDAGSDMYVAYGSVSTDWILLQGIGSLTATQLAQLTDPTASGPPPTGGGNDLPPHTVVIHDTFDNGSSDFGHFTNRWQETAHFFDGSDGGISVTSRVSGPDNGGAMFQGAGLGYGIFEFDFQASAYEAPGPYALLWPQTGVWPGPELDVVERDPGGQVYTAIHYDSQPGVDAYPADNGFDIYHYPSDVSLADRHTYAMNWQQDYIDMYVDGSLVNHITNNVPLDAAHGGENSLPGIGQLIDWVIGYQSGDNVSYLYDFKYSVVA